MEKPVRGALVTTAWISLPCAAGMSLMAEPLLRLLFRADLARTGAPLLSILALAVFFLSMLAMTNAILQATDHAHLPVYSMVAGAVVKLVSSWILTGIPSVGIMGTPVSTVLCYFTMALLKLIFVLRTTGVRLSFASMLWKPACSAVFCGVSAYACYVFLSAWGLVLAPAVLISVAGGALVYLAAMLLLGGFDKGVLEELP